MPCGGACRACCFCAPRRRSRTGLRRKPGRAQGPACPQRSRQPASRGAARARLPALYASHVEEIHTAMAGAPASVSADVEAGPVVNRRHGWSWCGSLGIRSQISSRGGSRHPKATNPTVPSKNFFIVSIPIVMRAVGRPGFVGWAKDPPRRTRHRHSARNDETLALAAHPTKLKI